MQEGIKQDRLSMVNVNEMNSNISVDKNDHDLSDVSSNISHILDQKKMVMYQQHPGLIQNQ